MRVAEFVNPRRWTAVSPWVLAAACALLALIIGVFAVNNYRREKSLMTQMLVERGASLIRFVNSGARAAFLAEAREGGVPVWQWDDFMQDVVERVAEHPGVLALTIIDDSGMILASSEARNEGGRVGEEERPLAGALDHKGHEPGDRPEFRFVGRGPGAFFQVAAPFVPLGPRPLEAQKRQGGIGPQDMPSREGNGGGRRRQFSCLPQCLDELQRVGQQRYTILVKLDLTQWNRAVRGQLLQIMILSLVLLLVGIGGWLSLLTLQGLKGSQSRLSRITAFRDTLISSLPVGLIVTDGQGRIIVCNRVAGEIASVQEQDILGSSPQAVLPPVLAQALAEEESQDGASTSREVSLRNLHGQSQSLQLTSLTIVEKDGQAAGRMALITDVSQIKSLQEELRRSERMAALGKMAAGVAHELRNPLSSIKGLALLLRSRFQGLGNDQETADILVQEVERLNRSIGELLAYARPQKLLKQPVQPAEIVEKAVSLIRMDAEAAGVLMTTRVVGEAPELLADPDKLNQVLLNLFLNAIQAMPQGGRLDIEIAGVGTTVEIRVQDSGMGISREDLSRVFDPYFTTKAEGTGLGLAMSLKIVEEHEGTITVTSEKNGGSLFVVSLPLNEGQSAG